MAYMGLLPALCRFAFGVKAMETPEAVAGRVAAVRVGVFAGLAQVGLAQARVPTAAAPLVASFAARDTFHEEGAT